MHRRALELVDEEGRRRQCAATTRCMPSACPKAPATIGAKPSGAAASRRSSPGAPGRAPSGGGGGRGPRTPRAVLKRRAEYPFMGKAGLKAVFDRRGLHLSVSTVGRILERALADGRIRRASFREGRLKPKRRRAFNGAWAQRRQYGAKAQTPGKSVQVDHMTYSRDGQTFKEFRAVCPVTKFQGPPARTRWAAALDSVASASGSGIPACTRGLPHLHRVQRHRRITIRVYSRATARNVRRFFDETLAAFPFAVSSIQTDGGSECMAEFENACAKRGHPAPCPAAPPAAVQRLRRTRQPIRPDRVPEPLRRTPLTFADIAPPPTPEVRVLPQLPAAPHGPGLPNPQRVLGPDRRGCLSR